MTQQPDGPPVDEAVLIELVSQIGDDDGALRAELIDSYLAEATDQVSRFLTATRTGDAETARALAHALKSASALLGAQPLARLLAEAEQVAITRPADLGLLAGQVQAEFARVVDAFTSLGSTGSG
jgi:HPt (histidine-containing phosphotransfer) domain-containing protein